MDINTKLIIKVQLNDEIRKMPIHNEDITYDELIIMMERVFKHKLNADDEIIIKYKDEDNDLITISDDSDLAFAMETSTILKLSLTIDNKSKEETKSNDLSSCDISSIRKELQVIRDYTNRLLDKLIHVNGDSSINTITSGRTSTVGMKDFQEAGGKEFDPLSTGNPAVERTETLNSLVSNTRNEDSIVKSNTDHARSSNQEMNNDSNEIHRPSPVNMHSNQIGPNNSSGYNQMMGMSQVPATNMNASTMPSNMPYNMVNPNMAGKNAGGQIMPPNMSPNMNNQQMPQSMISQNVGVQNMPPNMGGQNMPPNMGGQNMPPNMGGQNMPPNMGGQNMPPNVGGQNMPPNMGGQNMPPNVGGQNMPPNVGGQNMPPNMGGQSMPPNMGGQNMPPNMGGPNMPPNMGGANVPKSMEHQMNMVQNAPSAFTGNANMQSDPSKMSGYINQQGQRNFYPTALQPPRLSPSNFQGAGNIGNPVRPAGNYFSPQNPNSQFNPAISQSNMNYGYQTPQK